MILFVAFANPAVFTSLIFIVLFLGLYEFNRMGLAEAHFPEQLVTALCGATVAPILYFKPAALLPVLMVGVLALALMFLFRLPPLNEVQRRLGWLCLGLLYLPFLLGHLVPLRMLPDGREWIFLTFLAIMACDTLAYFFGSNFGKRKLYPAVSPNKSIEGGLGGLLG